MVDQAPFGFTVRPRPLTSDWVGGQLVHSGEGWTVYLPHQCDTWDIAGEGEYGLGESLDAACARLAVFIVEASEALEALRQQREYGGG